MLSPVAAETVPLVKVFLLWLPVIHRKVFITKTLCCVELTVIHSHKEDEPHIYHILPDVANENLFAG